MPKSRGRKKSTSARTTQAAQQAAAKKKLTPEQYARRRAFGWVLVMAGVVAGASHWLAHLGVLYDDRPLWDLLIGYPMAVALGVWGAVKLGRITFCSGLLRSHHRAYLPHGVEMAAQGSH